MPEATSASRGDGTFNHFLACDHVEAVVPGSAMLMGEHAVLRGFPAIVSALNRFVRVKASRLANPVLSIRSVFGDYDAPLASLVESVEYRFVLAVVRRWFASADGGIYLNIESDFSHQVGFGSSAAVTVGVDLVCRALLGASTEPAEVLPGVVGVVRAVQGCGSGSDVAASVFGGIVMFNPDALCVERVASALPVSLWYSGYKTPTPVVIRYVAEKERRYPSLYATLFQAMGMVTGHAGDALINGDREAFGQWMTMYQSLMESVGVCDPVMSEMIATLRRSPDVCGAKISGSGLGDCVVALHRLDTVRPLVEEGAGQYLEASVCSAGARLILPADAVSHHDIQCFEE